MGQICRGVGEDTDARGRGAKKDSWDYERKFMPRLWPPALRLSVRTLRRCFINMRLILGRESYGAQSPPACGTLTSLYKFLGVRGIVLAGVCS